MSKPQKMENSIEKDYLKDEGLVAPKHSTSQVWRYFGFCHEQGTINDFSQVSPCVCFCYC